MSDFLALLPIRLRDVRLAAGLSQHVLSKRCGVHEKTISSFETGSRVHAMKVAQLEKIAIACRVAPSELLLPPSEGELELLPKTPKEPPAPSLKKRWVSLYRSSDHFRTLA